MSKIKITVERIDGNCNLPMQIGDHFFVEGSRLSLPNNGFICIWALQSMMPIFPILAERDSLGKEHWIRKIDQFTCPDPKGLVHFRLEIIDSRENESA